MKRVAGRIIEKDSISFDKNIIKIVISVIKLEDIAKLFEKSFKNI